MRVLQFLTVRTPGATARLARLGTHPAVTTVFDLEDGLWDPLDAARTADLKAEGRAHLVELARSHAGMLASSSLGVRINRVSGPEGHRDLEALGRAARHLAFDEIVATKIECGRELDELAVGLRGAGVGYRTIVPIVETRAGIAALDEILDSARRLGVHWLVYGHFDFALDAGLWPFSGPADLEYWTQLRWIIAATEAAGMGHVHPPFFALGDPLAFEQLARRLAVVCGREFGMITIGRMQTALAATLARDTAGVTGVAETTGAGQLQPRRSVTGLSPEALATRIVALYMANRRDDVSFAINPIGGDFISPHLFLAARSHLASLADA